jgi:DNA-directed RNA polymerase
MERTESFVGSATLDQDKLNAQMRELGADRSHQQINKAIQRAQESTTPAGQRLLYTVLESMTEAIDEAKAASITGKPGIHAKAMSLVVDVSSETIAFLVARAILDCVSQARPLTQTAMTVSGRLEDEARFASLKQTDPGLYMTLTRQTKHSTSYRHKRTVFVHAANKAMIEWEPWSQTDRLRLGVKCVELFKTTTGLITTTVYQDTPRKRSFRVELTPEAWQWVNDTNQRCALLSPVWLPMVEEPNDWDDMYGGGYRVDGLGFALIKTFDKEQMKENEQRLDKTQPYVQSINRLQKTRWQINRRVFQIMDSFWSAGHEIAGIPGREDLPLPPKPHDIADNKEARRDWKRKAADVYNANNVTRSHRLQFAKVLWVANMFEGEEQIYFPHYVDFRGRCYPKPTFLHPQGPDYARSLLRFADSCTVKAGLPGHGWFVMTGANLYGQDKGTQEERWAWVYDHEAEIKAVADDPYENHFWVDADKPWQFLAWCFEAAELFTHGSVESHCPIHMDGSCNGICREADSQEVGRVSRQ